MVLVASVNQITLVELILLGLQPVHRSYDEGIGVHIPSQSALSFHRLL